MPTEIFSNGEEKWNHNNYYSTNENNKMAMLFLKYFLFCRNYA